ncbi:MAG: flagellar biosynthetic protein FliR, partial [Deltaproteobacteria bacterium]|nr:flagellar biosynthetic protein FliR [Deltaproteobacteria bacterium]
MDFIRLDPRQFQIFFLLLIRSSALLFILPFFGSRNWPLLTKVGLCLLMALILYPAARGQDWPQPDSVFDFVLIVTVEVMVALCLGLTINLILAGIQLGGE